MQKSARIQQICTLYNYMLQSVNTSPGRQVWTCSHVHASTSHCHFNLILPHYPNFTVCLCYITHNAHKWNKRLVTNYHNYSEKRKKVRKHFSAKNCNFRKQLNDWQSKRTNKKCTSTQQIQKIRHDYSSISL